MLMDLRGTTFTELERWITDTLGESRFRADQIFGWVHKHGITNFASMSNVSEALRTRISGNSSLTTLEIDDVQRSADGTQKLRLRCEDGLSIESVLIPRDDKLTLCISSQVGCALGCRFCATASMGIKRNLTPGEIVDQVYRARTMLDEDQRISNLVFMGMGEPLANFDAVSNAIEILTESKGMDFSPRRITVSTVGMVPGIRKLGQRLRHVGLAISLHATTNDVRDDLMPINKRWPIETLFETLRDFPLPRRRRITFEYIVLPGINNTPQDAERLAKLVANIPSKINLLPFNPWRRSGSRSKKNSDLQRPTDEQLDDFAEQLRDRGLTTTVRYSRGLDIAAACGQLALSP